VKRYLILLVMVLFSAVASAENGDTYTFDSVSQEQQYRHLTESLRCPKCQNNSIADSNSMIAADMRLKVYELLQQGQTPEEIKAWMIDRYGNFVSYQPPVTPSTLILWVGPALFVIIGALLIVLRGRRRAPEAEFDDAEPPHLTLRENADAYPDSISEMPYPSALNSPAAPPAAGKSGRRVLLPGALLLVAVSVGFYLRTGGMMQVIAWHEVQQELPALRAQVMDPKAAPLSVEQLARLALGIRSQLERDPQNLADWMILGRLAMVMNNATTAVQAFHHAYQLAPNNPEVRLSYAEVLTRSGDPQDNRQAMAILHEMAKRDGSNLRLLGLLAFNAFEQQDYTAATDAWDKMLALLPAGDARAEVIRRSIQQAKSESGQQNSLLAVKIGLSPEAEKMLPEGGVLYISVYDGKTPAPVAVKKLPLSHFPLSLTLDDSNAMMPERLLSALHQVRVSVRISRDGSTHPQPGDWYGLSEVVPFNGHQQLAVQVDQRVAGDNPLISTGRKQ